MFLFDYLNIYSCLGLLPYKKETLRGLALQALRRCAMLSLALCALTAAQPGQPPPPPRIDDEDGDGQWADQLIHCDC